MQHGHGHGRTHTYITGDVSTGHGHGGEHAYVTSSQVRKQAAKQRPRHEIPEPGPMTMRYVRNPESSKQYGDFGEQYGQHIEPHGRYLSEQGGDHVPDDWESGEVSFQNPLHLPFGNDSYQHPDNWKHQLSQQYGGKRGKALSRAIAKDGHDAIITHDDYGTREIVDLTHLHKRAVSVSWDHHDDAPETWSEDYRTWTKERPHAAAVSQAQEHVRRHHPAMGMELGSVEDATSSMQSMLRRNGHPAHGEGFVMRHPETSWRQSQAFTSDGQPGVSLHPNRWDYGTLAHEVAHHLHENELGYKPRDDETAHGPDFVRHYQNVLKDFGKGAPEKLGEKYQEALGRIRAQAGRRVAESKTVGPGQDWRSSLPPEHEEVVRQYEKYSPGMTSQQRAQFRSIVKSAPIVDGPVYRGADVKGSYGYRSKIEKSHPVGKVVNFSKHVSTTTRPEVAAGYGHVVYEIHDHQAKGIGNTLHEAIMPPGKYRVQSAEWRDSSAQANVDEGTQYTSPRLHVVLHPTEMKQAAWLPTQRLFGPTHGLDHRLFDENGHLKPDVRRYILETLGDWWKPTYGVGWDEWAKVYFAGSEASEWTSPTLEGNGDFDVLIGVDYDAFRANGCKCHDVDKTNEEITEELNASLRKLDEKTADAMIMVDGELTGPWDNTWYVNQDSLDIRRIKPYAAYDVSDDKWAVRPPHLPDWDISQFPEGDALVEEARAVASYVEAILKLPEPYRTQQGYALWQHLHSDRGRAFTEQGEGWYDPANVIEKWLDQQGLWEKLVEIMVKVKNDPTTRNAPANWSNDPHSSS